MSWAYKVSVKELMKFCAEWRSIKQLREKFDLSNTESWHCSKFMKTRPSDFSFKDEKAASGRRFLYKTKFHSLDEILKEEE